MKVRFVTAVAAAFAVGLLAGAGGAAWQFQRQWGQWFMDFNLHPLLAEVTYGLKELRQGNGPRLEKTLDATAWRNIGLLSRQLEAGLAMPAAAQQELQYHCDQNQRRPDALNSPEVAERARICQALLAHYARRT